MSTAPHDEAAHGAAASAHDDHAFDGEPIAQLPADEPRTPGWLPLLGIALFVSAAVAWLAMGDPAPAVAAPKPVEAAVAPVRPPAPLPPPVQAGTARPAGSGIGNLSPQQLEDLRKRIEEMRSKRGLGAPTGAPAAPAHPPHPGHAEH